MNARELLDRLGAPPCRDCILFKAHGGVIIDPGSPYRIAFSCVSCDLNYYMKPKRPPDDMVLT